MESHNADDGDSGVDDGDDDDDDDDGGDYEEGLLFFNLLVSQFKFPKLHNYSSQMFQNMSFEKSTKLKSPVHVIKFHSNSINLRRMHVFYSKSFLEVKVV